MKMKDILSEYKAKKQDKKGECVLCLTHNLSQDKIETGLICPYCNTKHHCDITDDDYYVVGMTNGYSPEDKIEKYITLQCTECYNHFSLIPEKINYNANHDVYYTGGKDYLNDDDENQIFLEAQKSIEKSLKQWKDRYEGARN